MRDTPRLLACPDAFRVYVPRMTAAPSCLPAISSPPGQPLTPPDRALLSAILAHDEDYPAVAAATGVDLLDLYDFITQPHVAQRLAVHRDARACADRAAALAVLRDVMKSSDSPVERRRAASAVLRALSPPRAGAQAAREVQPPRTPSPDLSGEDSAGRPAREGDPDHPADSPETPSTPPDATIRQLASASGIPLTDFLYVLHSYCAPGATLFGEPVPASSDDFIASPGARTAAFFSRRFRVEHAHAEHAGDPDRTTLTAALSTGDRVRISQSYSDDCDFHAIHSLDSDSS